MLRLRQDINDFAQLKGKDRGKLSVTFISGIAMKQQSDGCHVDEGLKFTLPGQK